jgi:cytochrome c oxidase subunit 3
MGVPLVNTIVLLSSGASVTWCHHSIINGFLKESKFSLFLTIFLGIFFTFLQGIEYIRSSFRLVDGVVGSTFFISTGFHGFHVLVGSTFLLIVYIKTSIMLNTNSQNVGFECSAWYWHFVDVVWLFLYSLVYWWGG